MKRREEQTQQREVQNALAQSAQDPKGRQRPDKRESFASEAIWDVKDVGNDDDDNDDAKIEDGNIDCKVGDLEVGVNSEEFQVTLDVVHCFWVLPVEVKKCKSNRKN